jgi:hypothetical protein
MAQHPRNISLQVITCFIYICISQTSNAQVPYKSYNKVESAYCVYKMCFMYVLLFSRNKINSAQILKIEGGILYKFFSYKQGFKIKSNVVFTLIWALIIVYFFQIYHFYFCVKQKFLVWYSVAYYQKNKPCIISAKYTWAWLK